MLGDKHQAQLQKAFTKRYGIAASGKLVWKYHKGVVNILPNTRGFFFFVIMFLLSLKQITKKSHDYKMQQQDTIMQYELNKNLTIQSTLIDLL